MNDSNGADVILVMLFSALVLISLFLLVKRGSKGVFGNRYLAPGALALSVIFFLLARNPITNFCKSIFKDAPYASSDLKAIIFKYGDKDSLVNSYNSASGEYQYVNKRDSLVKTHVNLTTTDLLYLHRKAAELGFWDLPAKEVSNDTTNSNGVKSYEYLIEFDYKQTSKSVLYSTNYDGPQQQVEASKQLIKEIQSGLANARDRQQK